jgi:hypothetical protein
MLRTIDQFVQVITLDMGEVYDLAPHIAAQFIDNGVAEPVSPKAASRLEAAALADAQKRG